MMFWYDHDIGGWGLFAMSASMILFWALVISAVFLLVRSPDRTQEHHRIRSTPEEILDERLAHGEIDTDEYERRLAALRPGVRRT
ncbi:SHOCT domain-containing protein [Streptomyces sp. NPDC059169]|uniref:SHOCT domain-containing protein n=1 Tax=Streptomyces sp. NPDC059169 TaxID=3346754 RepID=UPI0036B87CB9